MNDSWIEGIKHIDLSQNRYSQNGEELILKYILNHIGDPHNRILVDLGANDGNWLSNSKLLITEHGYNGILIDYDTKGSNVHNEFITAENICDLLKKYNCPKEFNMLSIDIDGNDLWVLKALLKEYSPRLIICEINGVFPFEDSRAMKYNPNHKHLENDYYGATLAAFTKLGEQTGYNVIYQNHSLNAYLVRKDLLEKPYEKHELNFAQKISTYSHEGEWVVI